MKFFADLYIAYQKPMMIISPFQSGKSSLIQHLYVNLLEMGTFSPVCCKLSTKTKGTDVITIFI